MNKPLTSVHHFELGQRVLSLLYNGKTNTWVVRSRITGTMNRNADYRLWFSKRYPMPEARTLYDYLQRELLKMAALSDTPLSWIDWFDNKEIDHIKRGMR